MIDNYKTVEEMSVRWGVTSRYVQSLCRQGKLEGAIKRGGIWFLPSSVPNPVKKTRAGYQSFHFVGTRKKIFDNAIELFMKHGFENVTVKDLGDAVGIGQSAVYNHFKSKQEILDTIYDFFSYYFLENRPSIEDIEPVLRHGSIVDIINSVRYDFTAQENEYDIYIEKKMIEVTALVFHRQWIDERARGLLKSLVLEEGIKFTDAVLNRAIEIGRLAPFDVHGMSVLILSGSLYTLLATLVEQSPESIKKVLEEEQSLYELAAGTLTDLKDLKP